MITKRFILAPILVLALAFGIVARATPAAGDVPPGDPACERVDFYVYNGYRGSVFLDVTNWTTYTRVLWVIAPGQEARFSLEAGFIEYWAESYDQPYWNDGVAVYLPGCSLAAAYIKQGPNGPGIKLHVKSPE